MSFQSPFEAIRSNMSNHDEYTDYSCSTSIERLARDVETLLRSWHVDGGSDRHVSVTTTNQQALLTSTHSSSKVPHLIRSDQLAWTVSFHLQDGQRISSELDLELTLWDGPTRNDKEPDEATKHLPFSLRRPSSIDEMPPDLFANFSTLFGIGQHITLSPLNVDLPTDLLEHLAVLVFLRHYRSTTSVPVVATILSTWLQTALNIAATNSRCCMPVFGLWGHYQPQQRVPSNTNRLFPYWIQAANQLDLPPNPGRFLRAKRVVTTKPKLLRRSKLDHLNQHFVAPLLAGQISSEDCTSTFWCSVLPATAEKHLAADSRLTVWGSVLLQHCPDAKVALWGARHVFGWLKPRKQRQNHVFEHHYYYEYAWRQSAFDQDDKMVESTEDIDTYRLQCQRYVLSRLEQAAGATMRDPIWGPSDDPVASFYATVTWNGRRNEETNQVQPLIDLPLKIRSRRTMSKADWIEFEESIEQTILDSDCPSGFCLHTHFDHDTPKTPLAATQRCVLAALIRTATLPGETMLAHLVDESLIDRWDSVAGSVVADDLATRATTGPATRALVAAMDWLHTAEELIEPWQAEEIVRAVLDGSLTLGFPSPPEGSLKDLWNATNHPKPLLKAAPPGRLLSILFLHMARVRSPCCMALVWATFVRELRRRWHSRESLPNMNSIPGLDPPPDASNTKRCFSNIGVRANFAAQVNSSEPDPDDFNCLVGQKLQVDIVLRGFDVIRF